MTTTPTPTPENLSTTESGATQSTTAQDVKDVFELTSLHFYPNEFDGSANFFKKIAQHITNPNFSNAYIIDVDCAEGNHRYSDLHGLDMAYHLLQEDPTKKVILTSIYTEAQLLKRLTKGYDHEKLPMLKWLLAHTQCVYRDILEIMKDIKLFNNSFGAYQSPEELEALQSSIQFYTGYEEDIKDAFRGTITISTLQDNFRKKITNPALKDLIIIKALYRENEHQNLQDFHGIKKAYEILQQTPDAKVLLLLPGLSREEIKGLLNRHNLVHMFGWLVGNPQCRILEIPITPEQVNSVFDTTVSTHTDSQQVMFEAEKEITKYHIAVIRHSLEGYKVKDPYNPSNESERKYVEHAFELTKKYFPGLDTIPKMLDYMLNINIEIPEVMKGQRIEDVYVDIDGTLIDYVPIGSPLEGTQQLRPKVVELLKNYEAQGKKIIIRTGGDVSMKEAYLRSLGITRPVVSKYDYAGAKAEIVVDDTDRGAFILQSKILPETYIDTRKMD